MKAMTFASIALLALASVADAQKKASYEIDLPGPPFGVVDTRDRQWIFVSLSGGGNGSGPAIAVLRNKDGPTEIARTIPMKSSPAGMVLTHLDDMLIVAAKDSVVFFDTLRMEHYSNYFKRPFIQNSTIREYRLGKARQMNVYQGNRMQCSKSDSPGRHS
jgi:hypothetical protein